jgi:hypothetical protein
VIDDTLLHKLWNKAVGTKGYVKKEWQYLEKQLWAVATEKDKWEADIELLSEHLKNLGRKLGEERSRADAFKALVEAGADERIRLLKQLEQKRRRRLPDTRASKTRKFSLPGDGEDERFKMYVTVGLFEDGTPGELFIRAARAGSLAAGLLDGLAVAVSLGLQHGVPLETFAEKFRATKFSPAGMTGDKEYPVAKSPLDYVAAWMRKLAGGSMTPGEQDKEKEV